MLGIPVLEVATGLGFVYLLFSLVVSAVNESVLGHLIHLRCHILEDGLRSLLSNQGNQSSPMMQVLHTLRKIVSAFGRFFVSPGTAAASAAKMRGAEVAVGRFFVRPKTAAPPADGTAASTAPADAATSAVPDQESIATQLLKHPLVAGLATGGRSCPNYIPPGTFANAMINILTEAARAKLPAGTSLTVNADTLRAGIATLTHDPHAQKLLASLLTDVNTIKDAREQLEAWFNHSMDRVSGAYKRNIQTWLYVWATLFVLILNLDTVEIVRRLWTDAEFRTVLVNNASRFVADTNNVSVVAAAPNGSTNQPLSPAELLQQINDVKLPLGWGQSATNTKSVPGWLVHHVGLELPVGNSTNASSMLVSGMLSGAAPCPQTTHDWWLKFLGLLITIGAISQGAPFWFDILNKVTNLRAAGRPPATVQPRLED